MKIKRYKLSLNLFKLRSSQRRFKTKRQVLKMKCKERRVQQKLLGEQKQT